MKLYNSDNVLISRTVTTDGGQYLFDDLTPGEYCLVFINPGEAGIWTISDQGDDAVDSDPAIVATDPEGDALATPCFTLTSGQTDLTWDAGLIGLSGAASAAAGNRVWVDANQNGLQDEGELGFPNATVQLYSADGTLLQETQTNDQGIYNFQALNPGDYYIEFIPPTGFQLTDQKVGTDDEIDSDIDPNTGRTATFTLIAFETNLRFDLGIFTPTGLDPEQEPQQIFIYLPIVQDK
ncbi:MAG: SdrD B-like domain-containing protein [Caldilineaceae bacterium]